MSKASLFLTVWDATAGYSLEDLAEIAVLQQLRHKGVSLQRMRKVIRFLQKEMGKRLYETVQSSASIHLPDGRETHLP